MYRMVRVLNLKEMTICHLLHRKVVHAVEMNGGCVVPGRDVVSFVSAKRSFFEGNWLF